MVSIHYDQAYNTVFDGLDSVQRKNGDVCYQKGFYKNWIPHTDSKHWKEVPNPELTQEHEKAMMIDQYGIDNLLDEVNNIDGKRKQQAATTTLNILSNQGY